MSKEPSYTENRTDFEPSKWGPHAWAFLHMLTFSYPEIPHPEVRREFQAFFAALRTVLPCAKCRRHFAEKFDQTMNEMGDDPFASRDSLTRWLIDIHNDVNASQGKPKLLRDQARRLYLSKDLLCSQDQAQAVDGGALRGPAEATPAYSGRVGTLLYVLLCLLLVCVGGAAGHPGVPAVLGV